MVVLTYPPNIKELHNTLVTQGFTPPDKLLVTETKSQVDLAASQFARWNDPDSISHEEQELIDAGVDPEFFNATAQSLSAYSQNLSDLDYHMTGNPLAQPGQPGSLGSANLIKTMSIATAEKTRQETLGIAPSDPCAAVSDLFGAITGGLNSALTGLATAIGTILELIGQGISAVISAIDSVIGPALAAIASAVGEITNTIAKELAKLAQVVADTIQFAQSLVLPNLFLDPCMNSVIETVSPPDLKEILNQVPTI